MTEFTKSQARFEKVHEELIEWSAAVGELAGSSDKAAVRDRCAAVANRVALLTTGELGASAEKFRRKAAEPDPEKRTWGEKMVARAAAYLADFDAGLALAREMHASLEARLAQLDLRDQVLEEIAASLRATVTREEAARAAVEAHLLTVELAEIAARGAVAGGWLKAALGERGRLRELAEDEERRARNREKKKAKQRQKQADLRAAADKRKEREEEQRLAELDDAFDRLLRSVASKEKRARAEVDQDRAATLGKLYEAFAKKAGVRPSPAGGAPAGAPGGGGVTGGHAAPAQTSPYALLRGGLGGAVPCPAGDAAKRSGRRSPPLLPEAAGPRKASRSPPKDGRRPRSPNGESNAPPQAGAFVESDFTMVPPAVLKLSFLAEPVPGTPSARLRNEASGIEIVVYKNLLKLRDTADRGGDYSFAMPEAVLTDAKARKRYERRGGQVARGGGSSTSPGRSSKTAGRSTDDDDDDDEQASSSAGDEGSAVEDTSDDDILRLQSNTDADEGQDEENDNEGDATSAIEIRPFFLDALVRGCVVVMMSVGGAFAGGVFVEGDCVVHTTFKRYVTRKKQGGRQSAHEGRTDTVGSAMRARHEIRFKELIVDLLLAWAVPLSHASAILLRAPGPVNRTPFYSLPGGNPGHATAASDALLKKDDPRVLNVPFTTHRPTHTEVLRIYQSMLCCLYKHQ
ncbi:VMS1-like protein [Diplonema papillatum]|nr:VMS1-like protein [Diplonema papillatum]